MKTKNIEANQEAAIRAMRDRVYGSRISDATWNDIKGYWSQPDEVKWLEGQCDRMDAATKKGPKP